jgi:S1-C subfamily serine protease
MRASGLALVVAIAAIFSDSAGPGLGAQSPPLSNLLGTLPEAGTAFDPSEEDLTISSPLPEGTSFQELGSVLKVFSQSSTALRGAQEIAAYRQAAPAVVLLKTKEGSGSGIVLQSGLIVTNRHVVEGVGVVEIFFKPNDIAQTGESTEFRVGRVSFVDKKKDLALITPETMPTNFKFLKIAARDDIEVGADVYAIGHPLGYSWTFTQGVVSGMRAISTEDENYTAIQTQTPINPGNSGGPLLNTNLEVVGINTWVRDISSVGKVDVAGEATTVARPAQGLNFAVSAKDIRSFLSDAMTGKLTNLPLQIPVSPGCSWKIVFNGRTKSNDAGLKTFSSRCDGVADAWEIFPDDKAKATQLYFDPERSGKSTVVVVSNAKTGKWETSLWDFFRDQTFAVVGRHDDGNIKPTRFEFLRS